MELDLATGTRSKRGVAAREALLAACPVAEDALVVNNGAAALVLATTALAAGAEVVVSRGELIEIGAGFRLPDLIASTGARLREVGTTNRTHLKDYADAIGLQTGCVLKVHQSNFRVEGFTASARCKSFGSLPPPTTWPWSQTSAAGCSRPTPCCPTSPTPPPRCPKAPMSSPPAVTSCSAARRPASCSVVPSVVGRMARHPLARAVRADKLTLAALEATVRVGPHP